MPSPKVNSLRPGAITPSSASAKVDPITGCPANCISLAGPKMRSRTSVPATSAGWTKVHSENFVSRVIACICAAVSPVVSVKTAN